MVIMCWDYSLMEPSHKGSFLPTQMAACCCWDCSTGSLWCTQTHKYKLFSAFFISFSLLPFKLCHVFDSVAGFGFCTLFQIFIVIFPYLGLFCLVDWTNKVGHISLYGVINRILHSIWENPQPHQPDTSFSLPPRKDFSSSAKMLLRSDPMVYLL